jgi:hypothetical protein
VGSKLVKYISRRFGRAKKSGDQRHNHRQPKAPVLIATDGCDKKDAA